jgi:hypothetical protein
MKTMVASWRTFADTAMPWCFKKKKVTDKEINPPSYVKVTLAYSSMVTS